MRFWIICSGESAAKLPARCTAGELGRALDERLAATRAVSGLKRVEPNGRRLYVSPRGAAHGTASLLVPGAEPVCEPLLDELRPKLPSDEKVRALWLWRVILFLRTLFGGKKARKAKKALCARMDEWLDRLEADGADCILISHPAAIALLKDRLRLRGYCVQRTGAGRVKPFEQMLLSKRDEHCGGCRHNCLLANPGCSIGRDKASRQRRASRIGF